MAKSTGRGANLALLGATGQTGRETLRKLLKHDFDKLKIYVRSEDKLLRQFPDILSDRRVEIHTGSIHDHEVLEQCLSHVCTIICTLGSDGMEPDTILSDSAHAIVQTLRTFKDRDAAWHKPRLIYLSSATLNERSAAARPKFVHWLIEYAFHYGYDELRIAQRLFAENEDLFSLLLVQPNVLMRDTPAGYTITTEAALLGCAYPDLGDAFVELVFNNQYEELNAVSVSSKNGDQALRYAPYILFKVLQGIFVTTIPGGVRINRWVGSLWPSE